MFYLMRILRFIHKGSWFVAVFSGDVFASLSKLRRFHS